MRSSHLPVILFAVAIVFLGLAGGTKTVQIYWELFDGWFGTAAYSIFLSIASAAGGWAFFLLQGQRVVLLNYENANKRLGAPQATEPTGLAERLLERVFDSMLHRQREVEAEARSSLDVALRALDKRLASIDEKLDDAGPDRLVESVEVALKHYGGLPGQYENLRKEVDDLQTTVDDAFARLDLRLSEIQASLTENDKEVE